MRQPDTMNVRYTASLCPECYREIPAMISIEDSGVVMTKSCPEHGEFQSLVEKDPEFYRSIYSLSSREIYPGYFVDVTRQCNLRCEYCLPGYAPLLKPDLSHVQIKDVKVGDVLVGFPESGEQPAKHTKLCPTTVLAITSRIVSGFCISTTSGKIVCSGDHRWLTPGRRWRQASRLRVGDIISCVGPVVQKPIFDDDYKKGYVAGVTLGDGTIDHRMQTMKGGKKTHQQYFRIALTDFDILDRVESFCKDLGINLFRKPFFQSERGPKSAVSGVSYKNRKPMQMLHISQRQAILTIESWFEDGGTISYRKGFVAGMFDAEGSCSRKTIRISQRPNGLIQRVEKYLALFGFASRKEPVGIRILADQSQKLKFFMLFDPACNRKFNLSSYTVRGRAKVISINPAPEQVMYDITTSTGTFTAYGLASHNCYYPLQQQDPDGLFSIDNIACDCAVNSNLAPFVLTGGEPTVRPDIVELVQRLKEIGSTEMLTNGVRLAEKDLFDRLVPELTREEGIVGVHLSIHPETRKWINVLAMVKERSLTLGSCLIVVNSREEFFNALEMVKRAGPLALCFRIKAASRIWNEQKPGDTSIGTDKIFVSDMLGWLNESGGYKVITDRDNKSVFVNVLWNGVWLMLVSWHDVGNVDLVDINCAPYYRARNGQIANFVVAGLINEGIEKGFLHGRPVDQLVDKKEEALVA